MAACGVRRASVAAIPPPVRSASKPTAATEEVEAATATTAAPPASANGAPAPAVATDVVTTSPKNMRKHGHDNHGAGTRPRSG